MIPILKLECASIKLSHFRRFFILRYPKIYSEVSQNQIWPACYPQQESQTDFIFIGAIANSNYWYQLWGTDQWPCTWLYASSELGWEALYEVVLRLVIKWQSKEIHPMHSAYWNITGGNLWRYGERLFDGVLIETNALLLLTSIVRQQYPVLKPPSSPPFRSKPKKKKTLTALSMTHMAGANVTVTIVTVVEKIVIFLQYFWFQPFPFLFSGCHQQIKIKGILSSLAGKYWF